MLGILYVPDRFTKMELPLPVRSVVLCCHATACAALTQCPGGGFGTMWYVIKCRQLRWKPTWCHALRVWFRGAVVCVCTGCMSSVVLITPCHPIALHHLQLEWPTLRSESLIIAAMMGKCPLQGAG